MYRLLSPFWNWQEGRIRAGWRLVIHLFCYLAAQLSPVFLLGDPDENSSPIWIGPLQLTRLALFIFLGMIVIVIVTWLIGVLLDRRPFAEFGFQIGRQWWLDLLAGLLLGALLMALIFATEWALGWIEIIGVFQVQRANISFGMAILSPLLLFIGVAIQEELLSRGYQTRNFAEGFNFVRLGERNAVAIGWILSSVLFSLLHLNNPNITWSSILTIGVAGLFLGIACILTGRLALSIGLHFTWNLFQGTIFGFPVSGIEFDEVTLIAIKQGGPTLWTGGAFGPEAGLIGILAILLGSLLIWGWVRWQEGDSRLHRQIARYDRRRSLVEQKPPRFGLGHFKKKMGFTERFL